MEDPEGQESNEEDSSKEDGWITPRNIEQIQQSTCWGSEPAKVQVGCVTTDFAMQASRRSVKPASPLFISVGPRRALAPPDLPFPCLPQNVLLQMGLHVLAFSGLLIRQARSYILRCHGCFR